jgi:hypothetical protein
VSHDDEVDYMPTKSARRAEKRKEKDEDDDNGRTNKKRNAHSRKGRQTQARAEEVSHNDEVDYMPTNSASFTCIKTL